MSTNQHPFDSALELKIEDNYFIGRTSPDYANVIGPFGGMTAAVMLHAVLKHPERQGEPISLTVNFASAVQDGEFKIEAQVMRTNRSTQHWFINMIQNGESVTTATAVLATRRETWQTTDLEFPSFQANAEPFATSMMPRWAQNYSFRFAGDANPLMSAESDSSVTLQMIQDKPPRPLDFLSLTAMVDVFPPRIFVRRPKMVPAGTVAITIYYHVDSEMLATHGDGEIIGHARGNRFYNRYCDQSAELWTPSGELLVTSTQIVYFKE